MGLVVAFEGYEGHLNHQALAEGGILDNFSDFLLHTFVKGRRNKVNGRSSLVVRDLSIRSLDQESLDHARRLELLRARNRNVQRSEPLNISCVEVGLHAHEVVEGVLGASVAGPVKRRAVLEVPDVDVDALFVEIVEAERLVGLGCDVHDCGAELILYVDICLSLLHQVGQHRVVAVPRSKVKGYKTVIAGLVHPVANLVPLDLGVLPVRVELEGVLEEHFEAVGLVSIGGIREHCELPAVEQLEQVDGLRLDV